MRRPKPGAGDDRANGAAMERPPCSTPRARSNARTAPYSWTGAGFDECRECAAPHVDCEEWMPERSSSDRPLSRSSRSAAVPATGSSTEMALRCAGARRASPATAQVSYLVGRDLLLPIYDVETDHRTEGARTLVEAVRRADGLLIASPGYHGGISGMVKNALDYVEDLADHPSVPTRPSGRLHLRGAWVASHRGDPCTNSSSGSRLRGWPLPSAARYNSQLTRFDEKANPDDPAVAEQLATIGPRSCEFARMRKGSGAFPQRCRSSPIRFSSA